MKLLNIPIDVPRVPHVSVDNRSKLKIWQINTVPKNYLIKCYSGLTLKYMDVRITETVKGITEIIAKSIFYVLNAYDVQIELFKIDKSS